MKKLGAVRHSLINSYCLPHYVIIMALILNLFDDSVWQALTGVAPVVQDPLSSLRSEAVKRIQSEGAGCCKGCYLREVCDPDQCGRR